MEKMVTTLMKVSDFCHIGLYNMTLSVKAAINLLLTCIVLILPDSIIVGRGEGPSKRVAKMVAAKQALAVSSRALLASGIVNLSYLDCPFSGFNS